MDKPRSSTEQFLRTLILALGASFLISYFINGRKPVDQAPARKAPTLAQAFKGIDPQQGPLLSKDPARDEIDRLQKEVSKNGSDENAQWSRLRIGLIQQYILGNLEQKEGPSGFLGYGPRVQYFPIYSDITNAAAGDAVEAQALYQTGDLLWRRSIQGGKEPSKEAAAALQAITTKARGNSTFRDLKIFVPREVEPSKVPLEGPPPGGFKLAAIGELRGNDKTKNPQGLIDRVNESYRNDTFFKIFDTVVRTFGSNPAYSYGLAILFFAFLTRTVMQPIYKRQYDSMKGMALIAPEMKKITEKYKGKADQGAQMAQMKEIRALQQRHGVNPLMGCGLALLQMPIFFFIVYPMIQHYEPKMELVGASFLWIQNLSRPDIPLLILYGISMFFSFRLSSTPPADEMQRQQQLIMSFLFPVMFPFFLITYPSAFTMYWMTYNALSTFFQWRMIKAADPKKDIVKTLMGVDLRSKNPEADAVPERPKGKAVNLTKAETNGHVNENAHVNGSNGKPPKAADQGAVLSPVDEPKKKKRK